MNVYRQIAAARTAEDLCRLTEQLNDMFGQLCPEIKGLIDLAEIRILASAYNVRSITTAGTDLVFTFQRDPSENTAELFANSPGIVRIPDPQTVHIRLQEKYFQPDTLFAVLRKILRKKTQHKL